MLEDYYVKPQTIDLVRGSRTGPEVERYTDWLAERGYKGRTVLRRVPLLTAFGELARSRGAGEVNDLPSHVDTFVAKRVSEHRGPGRRRTSAQELAKEVRGPVEQTLKVVVPGPAVPSPPSTSRTGPISPCLTRPRPSREGAGAIGPRAGAEQRRRDMAELERAADP